jgi:hypothetical protein
MGRTKLQKYFSYGRSCYVCNARRNTWARLRKIALADLMDQKWILYPPNSEPAATVEKAFRARGLGLPRASVTTHMMVMTGGIERTHEQYASIFGAAGFRLVRVTPTCTPLSIIEGLPV